MPLLRFAAILCFATSLVGCVQLAWHHPHKNNTEFSQDKLNCDARAASIYPPHIVTNGGDGSTKTTCTGDYGYRTCTTKASYNHFMPPTTDINEGNRNRMFNTCMESLGWSLIRVE